MATATATEKILTWINSDKHPIWWRHTVRCIVENSEFTENHYNEIFKIAKREAGFNEEIPEFEEKSKPISNAGHTAEQDPVILISLLPKNNVASLQTSDKLSFAKTGVTVIYGDNGVGKSSYAKILKNACLTRGEKPPVLGNVFSKDATQSSAEISFQIGTNTPTTLLWQYKGNEIQELKSIRIFDSKSAFHYVEKEGELSYRPAGLHILDRLAEVCKRIRQDAEKKIQDYSTPKILPIIDGTTPAGQFLKSISTITTAEQLKQHQITEEENQELTNLSLDILNMGVKTSAEIKKGLNRKSDALGLVLLEIQSAISAVEDIKFNNLNALRLNLITKLSAAEALRKNTFDEHSLYSIGANPWKVFWEAARSYVTDESHANNCTFPPSPNTPCPLCTQTISSNAAEKLIKFEAFVTATVQKDADSAKENLERACKFIKDIRFDITPYTTTIAELEDLQSGTKAQIDTLAKQILNRKKLAEGFKNLKDEPQIAEKLDVSVIQRLSEYQTRLKTEIASIVDEASFTKLLNEKKIKEKNLLAKKAIRDGHSQIEAEIKRLKCVDAYTKIKNQANTRSITTQSTSICDDYVTRSLKTYFAEELKFFNFNNYDVTADVRGSESSQLFKLKLKDVSFPVASIASEGEQKCLALAGIFAEMRADKRKSSVVFDDPVNSLDHKWRKKLQVD